MSWFHRITFGGMWEAVCVLKDRSDRKHEAARLETDPVRAQKLREEADVLSSHAERMRLAYHERQEGKRNSD